MGAIGGEELVNCEKMLGVGAREEKILVLVRLRPLNEKEIVVNEVPDWECINNTTILYRNSLREGSTFPSAYTFDRVYPGDCSTREVYEEGAREIALSVVSGINSSIFAYGQTSSGKTYTMVGITEYTVADIFDYIHKHEERAFVLKFTAIEIYNEAVRDLLTNDNTPLRLLDDPEKGTVVEKVTEETLRDLNHLKELLSICEAQRRIGETSLNDKSSRSHQILRLNIESSAREFLGKGNSTTLSASVNFIDLAGSERASQALSAGSRLKEGCHINRSLLTLSTVIRKLSKGRQGHINYRDSKLTRILQPCLGGNARTAIICTLSPARSHVEQTRNTLLFACCAKEVTTKAQVNVVMSDKALVKHLQKELARLESELKSPIPASSKCDYAALLRKKDSQIEKLEKENRELTKQLDLAQSRVEDLLRVVGNDQNSRQARVGHNSKGQVRDTWEDECSESESIVDNLSSQDVGFRKFNNPHYYDAHNVSKLEEPCNQLCDDTGNRSSDSDGYCKEVQCIETEESSKYKFFGPLATRESEELLALARDEDLTSQQLMSTLSDGDRGATHVQNAFAYNDLEQKLHDVQKTIDSFDCLYPDEPSPLAETPEMSSSRSFKLSKSWSCRENLMIGSSSPSFEHAEHIEGTPPNDFERDFLGRPKSVRRKFPLHYSANNGTLSRNNSQSSFGTESIRTSADEEITSLHTFVTGLKKMAKLQYDNQLANGQDEEAGSEACTFANNVRDIGLDPMQEVAPVAPPDWRLEFARQQRAILELWHSCCVSLVHRTYFFLLFKGDPPDSIYMEVELRRLSFLKETLSRGNQAGNGGRTITLPSSIRALHRERGTLSKLMQKRLSEEERKVLYQKWGIGLDSKRRKLQLANSLWINTKDMSHVMESAAVVAKLIKFSEQGEALKEMFGLSFAPLRTKRRSFGWKPSMTSLV